MRHERTVGGAGWERTYQVPPAERLGEGLPEILHAAHVAELLDDLDVEVVHTSSPMSGHAVSTRTATAVRSIVVTWWRSG